MGDASQPQLSRKQTIDQRIAAIRTRLQELEELREVAPAPTPSTHLERLDVAHRRSAAAKVGARRALASSAQAFRNAAAAHDQAANEHAKVAASGAGDTDKHLRQEAFHRAAAIADQQRAEGAESLLSGVDPIAPANPGSKN